MTWPELMRAVEKHLREYLDHCEGDPHEPSELDAKRYLIEVVDLRTWLASRDPQFLGRLELERRTLRAEAEVARLRELLGRMVKALEAVPDHGVYELELLCEARRG
jgi:hypothetical protein